MNTLEVQVAALDRVAHQQPTAPLVAVVARSSGLAPARDRDWRARVTACTLAASVSSIGFPGGTADAPAMKLSYCLPPIARSAGIARSFCAVLEPVLSPARLERLQLIVSELVTNSVKYGPGRDIRVELEWDEGGRVRGRVVDEGDGAVAIAQRQRGREGGRGLVLVDHLADRWGVAPGSTQVWFEIE